MQWLKKLEKGQMTVPTFSTVKKPSDDDDLLQGDTVEFIRQQLFCSKDKAAYSVC